MLINFGLSGLVAEAYGFMLVHTFVRPSVTPYLEICESDFLKLGTKLLLEGTKHVPSGFLKKLLICPHLF